jgi:hypothetical protein
MGYRIVRMSHELFEMMFEEGYTLPNRQGERIRVTKGLPEGAKLVDFHRDVDAFCGGLGVLLKFEHPSWEDTLDGERIPFVDVQFTMETTTEFRPWMFDKLTITEKLALKEQLERELAATPTEEAPHVVEGT